MQAGEKFELVPCMNVGMYLLQSVVYLSIYVSVEAIYWSGGSWCSHGAGVGDGGSRPGKCTEGRPQGVWGAATAEGAGPGLATRKRKRATSW